MRPERKEWGCRCRPTTVYTGSSVAASMLYKHLGPPRVQRCGMKLGTFLPFMKVSSIPGGLNLMYKAI